MRFREKKKKQILFVRTVVCPRETSRSKTEETQRQICTELYDGAEKLAGISSARCLLMEIVVNTHRPVLAGASQRVYELKK